MTEEKFVWVVSSGDHQEGYESVESVWSTEEAAKRHMEHLAECFKYVKCDDKGFEFYRGTSGRWLSYSEHEVDPEV